jgi:hypothetical protein
MSILPFQGFPDHASPDRNDVIMSPTSEPSQTVPGQRSVAQLQCSPASVPARRLLFRCCFNVIEGMPVDDTFPAAASIDRIA